MTAKKTVSLALGSGGARGLAHIGIIRWLEAHGCEIRSIAGSSMGALVGGIHAIGKLDEYEAWVRTVTKGDMLALLDVSLGTDGLIKGDRIIDTLRNLVGERHIEDLEVSFTAVAANITRRKEVWFRQGPIFDAIKASISLPLLFKPFILDGEDLIDGGILNPVPIAPTFSDQTDLTVAVNLCAPHEDGAELPPNPKHGAGANGSLVSRTISDFVDAVGERITRRRTDIPAYNILYRSFDAMQGTIARQKIAAYPPDCVINVPANLCSLMDFDRAAQLIEYGYRKADEVLSAKLNG
ncbi:patatin-like phospholipase family protein [Pseudodesulfovibrio sp.]|uniref:patatin-like phospholipase family protein n=1 Tax=Pseudodesulfovibrio sp. TaxID=2035812 RepID=UPI00261B0C45|nr:patatin-like phospholipase family protein [Pseudodesulfovibrio sp.]MDD3311464.1 patatin-like phospholipase family protein [Pseudodesulfovibrio sp.]